MDFSKLAAGIDGRLIHPDDSDYDAARRGWNATLDSRPAAILLPAGVEDLRSGLLDCRSQGRRLAVQATGHGTLAPADGGLLIRTSGLNRIQIDPHARLATVGPGATCTRSTTPAPPSGWGRWPGDAGRWG